jgi:hypothetical protein
VRGAACRARRAAGGRDARLRLKVPWLAKVALGGRVGIRVDLAGRARGAPSRGLEAGGGLMARVAQWRRHPRSHPHRTWRGPTSCCRWSAFARGVRRRAACRPAAARPPSARRGRRRARHPAPARAENFWLSLTSRAHTKSPYKTDLLWKTLRALKRPGGPGPSRTARRTARPPRLWPRRAAPSVGGPRHIVCAPG